MLFLAGLVSFVVMPYSAVSIALWYFGDDTFGRRWVYALAVVSGAILPWYLMGVAVEWAWDSVAARYERLVG